MIPKPIDQPNMIRREYLFHRYGNLSANEPANRALITTKRMRGRTSQ